MGAGKRDRNADGNRAGDGDPREARSFCTCIEESDVAMNREEIGFETAKLQVEQILSSEDPIRGKTPGSYQRMDAITIKFKKKLVKLKRRDDPIIGSLVTYIGRDPYYKVESLKRGITEQERPADKPEPAHRRPGRLRRVV
jgi:hypothetical protein